MNRKHFLIVLVAVAIIGGAGLVLLKHNKESWSVREAKMGDVVLAGFKPNDVAAIHIKGNSEVHIAQTNGQVSACASATIIWPAIHKSKTA